jgi:pSer/pThr/pTyr-binding forkhead associated (FHA) protein
MAVDNIPDTRILLRKVSDGSEVEVTDELTVGRLPESGLVLTEGHPSRRHALIKVQGSSVTVDDLGSANGTFVNDNRLSAPATLASGDRVRFDTEEYEFIVIRPAAAGSEAEQTMLRTPESAAVDATSSSSRASPAWIDPDKHAPGGPKTEFIDAAKIREMMQAPGLPEPDAPAENVDAPTLFVASGKSNGTRVVLRTSEPQGEWTVGSDADRDIRFNDEGVSGVHAKISFDGQRWRLSDQMSANGTYVNGKRSNMSYLSSGDRIRFGPVECSFQTPQRSTKAARHGARSKRSDTTRNLVLIAVAFVVTLAILYLYMYLWR